MYIWSAFILLVLFSFDEVQQETNDFLYQYFSFVDTTHNNVQSIFIVRSFLLTQRFE